MPTPTTDTTALMARLARQFAIDPQRDTALEWEAFQALDALDEDERAAIAAYLDRIQTALQCWHTIDETAAQFGVKPKVIRQLAAAGVLRSATRAGQLLFHQRDIDHWLRQGRTPAGCTGAQ